MPEDKEIQHRGQYDGPEYSGEDLEGMDFPEGMPQEHIPPSPVPTSPVGRASKSEIIKRIIYILLAIILAGVIVFAGWKFLEGRKNNSSQTAQIQQDQPKSEEQANPVNLALGSTSLTKTYTSDFLNLEFKYPESWNVREKDNYIIVKSPNFDIEDKSGVQSSTYFKVYIERSASSDDGKYLGRGYAVAPSEKISYSSPATGQRKDTYLTNFGLDTPDNFAYFVVQGSFKLKKGETLGPNFANEPEAFLVAGGFATDEQKGGLETRQMPADITQDNLAYKTGIEIVRSLQLN
ncbi:MAG TPA: hypothetical protein VFK11_03225 [Candidatus Saccharimonadales bacterium]|nr:hypothetical protein [Candidatus Saccharimonadales bacterium]